MISEVPWFFIFLRKILVLSLYVCMLSHFSRVQLFVTPWTVACLAPLSMGFSRQEYWSGLPCSPPRDLPNPGIKPISPALLHYRQILCYWVTREALCSVYEIPNTVKAGASRLRRINLLLPERYTYWSEVWLGNVLWAIWRCIQADVFIGLYNVPYSAIVLLFSSVNTWSILEVNTY